MRRAGTARSGIREAHDRAVHARRVVPPEPAEHVHGPAARRRCSTAVVRRAIDVAFSPARRGRSAWRSLGSEALVAAAEGDARPPPAGSASAALIRMNGGEVDPVAGEVWTLYPVWDDTGPRRRWPGSEPHRPRERGRSDARGPDVTATWLDRDRATTAVATTAVLGPDDDAVLWDHETGRFAVTVPLVQAAGFAARPPADDGVEPFEGDARDRLGRVDEAFRASPSGGRARCTRGGP